MFTFSFSSAFAAAPAAADQVAFDTGVSVDLQKAANDLIAAEKAVKDGVLTDIFGSAASATLNGAKVKRASVEAIYDKEVYNVKVAAINTELSQKLQAAQAAMQVTSLTAGELATVQSEFGATASSKVVFAGYFVEGPAAQYDYDAVLDTVYVYPAYSTTFTTAVNSASAYTAVFDDGATPAVDEPTGTKILDVAKEVFKDTKDVASAAIQGVDLTAYSKDYNGEAQSNYDKAAALVDEYMGKLAQAETNAKAGNTWATYIGWKNYIDALYTAPVNQQPATGEFVTKLNAIPKIADATTEEAKLSFAKNKVLAKLKDDISTLYDGKIATLDNSILSEELKGSKADAAKIAKYKEQKETLVEKKDAVTDVATYLVNSRTAVADLIKNYTAADGSFDAANAQVRDNKWKVFNDGTPTGYGKLSLVTGSSQKEYSATLMVNMVEKIADLKADAELLKASIAIDGTTAVGIDEALEDAIDTVYTTGDLTVTLPGNTQLAALVARINALTGTGSVKVNDRSYKAVGSWATTGFEADQNDEVRAAIKEANDTICAAKSIEEADAAFLAALEKFNAIPTTADKTKVQNTKEFKDLLALYTTDITNYANYKNAVLDSDDYEWDPATMAANLIADFSDAYTVDELKAAYEAAKAEIDNIKTKAALDAVKKDLDARVNALVGKTVTLADKEAITALNKEITDHNEYCDMLKTGHSKKVTVYAAATNAAEYIKKLEDKAITDAYDEIMKDGKVTVAEKAAVEALRAAYDAYVKDYTEEDAAALTLPSIGNNMNTVEGLLSAALVNEVETAIAKLTVNPVDAAAVKAARNAYEALSTFEKNAVGRKYYDKLVDCEKVLAEDAKAYVQDLSIKARSTKTSKGVKVTINADVQPLLDAGFTVEYKFYRSTKSNKNFGTAKVTKTTNTYLNTSGVKGTKYYYKAKLVVKNAAGEVVATTPLTQCLYATRTF
ncbi:MAG: hypothetical protein ACI4LZ_06025 [Anaerovoracaceae bacterium]